MILPFFLFLVTSVSETAETLIEKDHIQSNHSLSEIPESERDPALYFTMCAKYVRMAHFSKVYREKAWNLLTEAKTESEYQKGIYRLYQWALLREEGKEQDATYLLEEAIQICKKAYMQKNFETSNFSAQKNELYALALCYLSASDAQYDLAAYHLLSSTNALKDPDGILQSDDSRALAGIAELYYLLGVASLRVWKENGDPTCEIFAIHAWDIYLTYFPKGFRNAEIVFIKGLYFLQKKMYENSEKEFVSLVTAFPDHCLTPQGLYFLAQCLDRQGKVTESRTYRKQIWQNFPNSPLSAEAYFNTFTRNEYLDNAPSAIDHLRHMEDLYPHSSFLIPALFLLGQHYTKSDPKLALENFNLLIEKTQFLNTTQSLLEPLAYTKIRALLEKGNILIQESEKVPEGIKSFQTAYQEIDTLPLKQEDAKYLKEEAAQSLAQAYYKAEDLLHAEEILNQLLENYGKEAITKGYFLSRSWFFKGCIAAQRNNHEQAIIYFAKARECANERMLNGDQIVDLYIHESESLKSLQRLDQAMLTLSKAVNENVVSFLRLKAMYLRAEIYDQQGRCDLAERQLESLAKKQGEWAIKAKVKLKEMRKRKIGKKI